MEIQPHAAEHSYEGSQFKKSAMNTHAVGQIRSFARLCFHHFICGSADCAHPNLAWVLHDKCTALALRNIQDAGNVVCGYPCFGLYIRSVHREGRGTEVWRSCLGRRVGRLWPGKHKGQPRFSNSFNQQRVLLGTSGTRRDKTKNK